MRNKDGLSANTTDMSEGRDDVHDRDVVHQKHLSACLFTPCESQVGLLFHTALTFGLLLHVCLRVSLCVSVFVCVFLSVCVRHGCTRDTWTFATLFLFLALPR